VIERIAIADADRRRLIVESKDTNNNCAAYL